MVAHQPPLLAGTGEGYHKETVTICTSTISVVIGAGVGMEW